MRNVVQLDYPPFDSRDTDGQLVGFDVDVAKAVAARLGVKPQFITTEPHYEHQGCCEDAASTGRRRLPGHDGELLVVGTAYDHHGDRQYDESCVGWGATLNGLGKTHGGM